MLEIFLTALPLGFFLSFMIGPVFFLLLETSILKGFRAAFSFDLGVITSDIVFIFIAYFSSYQLINSIQHEPALYIFGGGIMVAFGIISFLKIRKQQKQQNQEIVKEIKEVKNNYFKLFTKGFLLNFINIGVLGFWLGVIITFGPKFKMEAFKMGWFFFFVIFVYLLTDVFKILLAKKLKKKLTTKNILLVKKISSVILMVFGGIIMLKSLF